MANIFKLFLAEELVWCLSCTANTSLVNTTLCNGWFLPFHPAQDSYSKIHDVSHLLPIELTMLVPHVSISLA
jgi:hypothetical protein